MIKVFILLSFIFLFSTACFSAEKKTKEDWIHDYKSYLKAYQEQRISENQYVQAIDSITEFLTVSGIDFSKEDLTSLLEPFMNLVWDNPNYLKIKEIILDFS